LLGITNGIMMRTGENMAYTSVFATRFAAPIWVSVIGALAALATTGAALAAADTSLGVSVTGLRNKKGNVLVCLTANSKAFPDCSKDPNAQKRTVKATAAGSISFGEVAPGTYALSLIHDENANGKLDTSLAIPNEGFGFSRNPKITFGPPKFKSAAFTLNGAGSQSVKMKYMF
jgi:uncharacterized protein (DUF2141 family)